MKSRLIPLILIGILAVVLLGLGIVKGNLFTVKDIVIESQTVTDDDIDAILEIVGINYSDSMLSIDSEKACEVLGLSGTYSCDAITLVYPSTVKIHVEKRIPHAVVESEHVFILIDNECNVISTAQSYDAYNLPTFTGVRIAQYSYGTCLETKDPYQKNLMLSIMETLYSQSTVGLVSVVSLEDPSNMYIITSTGKKLQLNEAADVAAKLSHLATDELQELIFSDEEFTITLYKNSFVIS